MQLKNLKYNFIILLGTTLSPAFSQKDAETIYDGNNMYFSGKVPESSAKYARALEINPNNRKANFNLGDAIYKNALMIKSGKIQIPPGSKITPDSLAKMAFDKAAQNFAIVANSVSDKDTLHRAWHNIGNCYLQKKEYQQAVDAYKKSLKFNPKDEETRYNLAFALKNLPKDKKQGGGGQSNQPQNKKEEQKKDPKEQQSQMSKDQAEQLLKALMDSEKKLQDKRKQKQEDPSKRDVEKDW
ncbi:MAG: tetratricopeptide repeat protein [bacterium]|nr:tetratricopeptide repeat protein [bacterium]